MHFARLGAYGADDAVHVIARGKGCWLWDVDGHRLLRRAVGPVHRAGRARAPGPRRGGAGASRDARVLPDLDVRPPARDRARGSARRAGARRPEPGVLHQRRVGGGRVGVEARPPVLPCHRPGTAPQGDRAARRAYHGTTLGRPRHHRRARAAHTVRAAHARRGARRQHQPPAPPARRRREGVHARGHRRDRGADPVRRPRDGGRGLPRAGPERGRVPRAAGGLLRRACARSATATACCSCPTR